MNYVTDFLSLIAVIVLLFYLPALYSIASNLHDIRKVLQSNNKNPKEQEES